MPHAWQRRRQALRNCDVAFIEYEVARLARATPDEFEYEGRRWRSGILDEIRSHDFIRFARIARRRGCARLGELDRETLYEIALRINGLSDRGRGARERP
jgi:hypothetical protein